MPGQVQASRPWLFTEKVGAGATAIAKDIAPAFLRGIKEIMRRWGETTGFGNGSITLPWFVVSPCRLCSAIVAIDPCQQRLHARDGPLDR